MNIKNTFFIVLLLFLVSCSKILLTQNSTYETTTIDKNKTFIIINFKNNSETLFANEKAKDIINSLLIQKGYKTILKKIDFEKLDSLKSSLANPSDYYIIFGSVNEWRYQIGIDGKPAINLSVYIYDISNDKTIFSSTVAAIGSAYESLGIVALKAIKKLTNKL